jgi:hypothetical protein
MVDLSRTQGANHKLRQSEKTFCWHSINRRKTIWIMTTSGYTLLITSLYYSTWWLRVDNNKGRFLVETLVWISIYFGTAFIISRLLQFPYSLIIIMIAVIGLGFYRRLRYFQRIGQTKGSSSSYFGGMFRSQKFVNYYCINCGTNHKDAACPNCGSKLKKAVF